MILPNERIPDVGEPGNEVRGKEEQCSLLKGTQIIHRKVKKKHCGHG